MSMVEEKGILVAGSGGQGILLLGQMIAYSALQAGLEVTWFPSYGAEMRGGTANCTVVVGSEPIGSPIVKNPDILIVMNLPSYERFIPNLKDDGKLFYDSTFVDRTSLPCSLSSTEGNGCSSYGIASTAIAKEIGAVRYANMVMYGAFLRHSNLFGDISPEEVLKRVLPPRHHHLIEQNLEAIRRGYEHNQDS